MSIGSGGVVTADPSLGCQGDSIREKRKNLARRLVRVAVTMAAARRLVLRQADPRAACQVDAAGPRGAAPGGGG